MILSAHQPHYLPWLGYIDKIDRSDIFVLLDDVQYEKNGWQNRNRIRTPKEWQWLTVPVHASLSDRLIDVQIIEKSFWQKGHAKSLELNYRKAPSFSFLWEALKTIYEKPWHSLAELNLTSLRVLLERFGIEKKRFVRSSTLDIKSHATQRLVDLCKHFGAEVYLSGDGAAAYLDESLFQKEEIQLVTQSFTHPLYTQCHEGGRNFIEGLSCVDLLFNYGEESLELLRQSKDKK